jgi:hypothetical protein
MVCERLLLRQYVNAPCHSDPSWRSCTADSGHAVLLTAAPRLERPGLMEVGGLTVRPALWRQRSRKGCRGHFLAHRCRYR